MTEETNISSMAFLTEKSKVSIYHRSVIPICNVLVYTVHKCQASKQPTWFITMNYHSLLQPTHQF